MLKKKMLTPSFATEGEEVVGVSGERAGLVFDTAAPSGLLLVAKGFVRLPDLVFFHGVPALLEDGMLAP